MKTISKLTIIGVVSLAAYLTQAASSLYEHNIEAFHTKWFWTRPKEGTLSHV